MTGRTTAVAAGTALVLLAATAATAQPLGGVSAPAQISTAGTTADWEALVERAARLARTTAFEGEVMLVTWIDGDARAARVHLASHGGTFFVDGEPAGAVGTGIFAATVGDPTALNDKYAVTVEGTEHLMDRTCVQLAFHLRDGDALRERVWLDERSGLVVRRETYSDGELARVASYLSLELGPAQPSVAGEQPELATAIAPDAVAALRTAGWELAPLVPGGYRLVGAYVPAGQMAAPPDAIQGLYSDGLYAISVFEQPGAPDRAALPEGSQPVPELDGAAEWPEAVPPRVLRVADGATYTVVGEAPRDELLAVAAALGHSEGDGVFSRMRRGLRRLWDLMSPWS